MLQLCERILPEEYGIDGIYGTQVARRSAGYSRCRKPNQSLQEVVQVGLSACIAYGKRFVVMIGDAAAE